MIQGIIKKGEVKVNNNVVTKVSTRLNMNDKVDIQSELAESNDNDHITPWQQDLDIYYEDSEIMVINKPAGLTVHPGAGNKKHTLVNILKHYLGDNLSMINGATRMGIVHRIDKNTSGLLVVAKTNQAHAHLAQQLKNKSVERKYLALCYLIPKPLHGVIENRLVRSNSNRLIFTCVDLESEQGKIAKTEYQTIEVFKQHHFSLLKLKLFTGRTHQIRAHMKSIKNPIVGDSQYYLSNHSVIAKLQQKHEKIGGLERQFLHAYKLGFVHPTLNEYMEFKADMPSDLNAVLESIR